MSSLRADDTLFNALISSQDVNVVLLDYDNMRRRMPGEEPRAAPPKVSSRGFETITHGSPIRVYRDATHTGTLSTSGNSSTTTTTSMTSRRSLSSSLSSSGSDSFVVPRPPVRVAYKKIVMRRVAENATNSRQVNPYALAAPSARNRPTPPTAHVHKRPPSPLARPDALDDAPDQDLEDFRHSPTRGFSSSPRILPPTVVPTGVPVIVGHDFRKMLVNVSGGNGGSGAGSRVDVASTEGFGGQCRLGLMAPIDDRRLLPPPPSAEASPRDVSVPCTRVVQREEAFSVHRERVSHSRGRSQFTSRDDRDVIEGSGLPIQEHQILPRASLVLEEADRDVSQSPFRTRRIMSPALPLQDAPTPPAHRPEPKVQARRCC